MFPKTAEAINKIINQKIETFNNLDDLDLRSNKLTQIESSTFD